MKIAAMSQEFRRVDKTIEDTVAGLAKIGLDGIELECNSTRLPVWDMDRFKKIKEVCDSHNMKITNLAPQTYFLTYSPWNTNKELLNVKAACEVAAKIDVPYVRVQIIAFQYYWLPKLEGKPNRSIDEQYSQGVDTLSKAVKIAEDIGANLILDNHFSLKVLDHLRIVKELNSPNLKITIDTRNCIENGENLIESVRACAEYLVHGHLKDAIRGVGGNLQASQYDYGEIGKLGNVVGVPVGMGNILNWEEYLRTLKEIGYKGFLSIEGAHVSPLYTPYVCTEMGASYLKKLNEKVGL